MLYIAWFCISLGIGTDSLLLVLILDSPPFCCSCEGRLVYCSSLCAVFRIPINILSGRGAVVPSWNGGNHTRSCRIAAGSQTSTIHKNTIWHNFGWGMCCQLGGEVCWYGVVSWTSLFGDCRILRQINSFQVDDRVQDKLGVSLVVAPFLACKGQPRGTRCHCRTGSHRTINYSRKSKVLLRGCTSIPEKQPSLYMACVVGTRS